MPLPIPPPPLLASVLMVLVEWDREESPSEGDSGGEEGASLNDLLLVDWLVGVVTVLADEFEEEDLSMTFIGRLGDIKY